MTAIKLHGHYYVFSLS